MSLSFFFFKHNMSVLHLYFMRYFYISGYEVGTNGQR